MYMYCTYSASGSFINEGAVWESGAIVGISAISATVRARGEVLTLVLTVGGALLVNGDISSEADESLVSVLTLVSLGAAWADTVKHREVLIIVWHDEKNLSKNVFKSQRVIHIDIKDWLITL